jgi:hypothetical protein
MSASSSKTAAAPAGERRAKRIDQKRVQMHVEVEMARQEARLANINARQAAKDADPYVDDTVGFVTAVKAYQLKLAADMATVESRGRGNNSLIGTVMGSASYRMHSIINFASSLTGRIKGGRRDSVSVTSTADTEKKHDAMIGKCFVCLLCLCVVCCFPCCVRMCVVLIWCDGFCG